VLVLVLVNVPGREAVLVPVLVLVTPRQAAKRPSRVEAEARSAEANVHVLVPVR